MPEKNRGCQRGMEGTREGQGAGEGRRLLGKDRGCRRGTRDTGEERKVPERDRGCRIRTERDGG